MELKQQQTIQSGKYIDVGLSDNDVRREKIDLGKEGGMNRGGEKVNEGRRDVIKVMMG
jgi:hypothetical protein